MLGAPPLRGSFVPFHLRNTRISSEISGRINIKSMRIARLEL